jgi:membrane protease subunit HflK
LPDEEGIVEHFGNPVDTTGKVRHVMPGLTFKWPWPIDIAYMYPTKKISEISIGFVPKIDPETGDEQIGPKLWGETHYEEEYRLLVASEHTGAEMLEGDVPVSLVMAAIPVQYRIKDLYSFIYNHNDTEKLLESICYCELTRFAASARIEVDYENPGKTDASKSLLAAGKTMARNILIDRIQRAADEAGLGVEIVFVGMQGIHPPPEVAPDYQKVVGAVQKRQALILEAQAERNKSLSALAGSVRDANELYELAAKYQKADSANDTEEIRELGSQLDKAFADAKGDIFKTLSESQSYAFEKGTLARATGERFAGQLKAYQAAENIYKHHLRLTVFEEALEAVRKYVVVADQNDMQVFIVDVKEKLEPDLYDLSGIEENR